MSGGELAVVLAGVAIVVAVAVLAAVGVTLNRALRDLRRLLSEIRRDLLPAVQRLEKASGEVTGEVQRVGGLLDVAERVSERAETLSRVTSRALLEPLNAVAALVGRRTPSEPAARVSGEPASSRWDGRVTADAPQPPRRVRWARRLTLYVLRSGYRSAAARLAARLPAAQAQSNGGTAGVGTNRGPVAAGQAGPGRRVLESIREVTREIAEVMEQGRQALRADRVTDDRST